MVYCGIFWMGKNGELVRLGFYSFAFEEFLIHPTQYSTIIKVWFAGFAKHYNIISIVFRCCNVIGPISIICSKLANDKESCKRTKPGKECKQMSLDEN